MSGFASVFQRKPNFGTRASTLESSGKAGTSIEAAQCEGEPLALSGYMEKRGGPTNPAYKQRWCTLTRYGNFRYFKDEKSTAKLGDFKITSTCEFEAFGAKEMRIVTPTRTWEFKFINVEKRAEWYLMIQEVVNQLYLWVDDDDCDSSSVLGSLRAQYEAMAISTETMEKVAQVEARSRGRASMTNRNSISGSMIAKIRNGENNNNITLQKLLEIQTSLVPRAPGVDKQSLDVLCLTWNLAEYLPDLKELDFLSERLSNTEEPEELPTLIAVSVQECQPVMYNITDCKIDDLAPAELWRTMVQSVLGRHYSIIGNRTMGAIQCTVFCKVNKVHAISHMHVGHVPCGIGNFIQNKGAVGVSFFLHETSFAFVCAHLPAHQRKVTERNNAYHRIDQLLTPLLLGGDEEAHDVTDWYPSTQSHLCSNFDYVFFMGDFNYRVDCRDQERYLQMLQFMDHFERRARGAKPAEVVAAAGGANGSASPQKKTAGVGKASRRLTALSLTTLIDSRRQQRQPSGDNGEEEEEDDHEEKESWPMDAEEDELFKRIAVYYTTTTIATGGSCGGSAGDGDATNCSNSAMAALCRAPPLTATDKKLYDDVLSKLLSMDQLSIERMKHNVFTDYEEPTITFRPSYKFAPDTDIYSCLTQVGKSKLRTPAWCDRIMFKKPLNLSLSGCGGGSSGNVSASGGERINSVDSTGVGSRSVPRSRSGTDSLLSTITNGGPSVMVKSYECEHGKYHSDHRAVLGEFTVRA